MEGKWADGLRTKFDYAGYDIVFCRSRQPECFLRSGGEDSHAEGWAGKRHLYIRTSIVMMGW